MQSKPPPRVTVRFGAYELDRRAHQLRKNGRKLKLREQPLQVLAILLERPGELVTRDELQKRLWSEDTFVDFDNSLNTAIARLRDVLGDSAHHPRYIETVPRQGYRFVALVEDTRVRGRFPPTMSRRVFWVAAPLFALFIGVIAIWLSRDPRPGPEPVLKPVPLTSYPGEEWSPVFSPDGSQVAFHWNGDNADNWDIYVKQVGSNTHRQLTNDPGADAMAAWSPDGRQIAFQHRLPSGKTAIMLIPAIGGPTRKIAETFGPSSWEEAASLVPPFLTWSPDGEQLIVVDRDSRDDRFALFSLSVDSGKRHRLTLPPSESVGDAGPAFSPDGSTLAFHRVFWRDRSDLYLLLVSNKLSPEDEPTRLPSQNRFNTSPTWTANGRDIVFCSSPAGRSPGLWRIRVKPSPGEPKQLRFAGIDVWHPALSPNGDRLAYASMVMTSDLWQIEVGNSDAKVRPPLRLNSSTRDEFDPDFSPDGGRIAFTSNRSGTSAIWVSDEDGSNLGQLTPGEVTPAMTPRWSPDGQRIVFMSRPGGQLDVCVIHVETKVVQCLTDDATEEANPMWSRDGKSIYFDSKRGGRRQVWRILATGRGSAVQVTREGGLAPQESPAGDHVYYVKPESGPSGLWRVPVNGGPERLVLDSIGRLFAVGVDGIYYVRGPYNDGRSFVEHLSTATGETKRITSLPGRHGIGFTVSPDGRSIVYSQFDQFGADLVLVENFQ